MENEFQEKLEPDVERKAQNNEKTRVENNLEIRIENEVGNKTETVIDLMQKPKVDSDLFFKLIDSSIQGSREYRLISSAFELGVFEALKVPLSAGALADKLGCNPVLMPHFCEALCILGLLDRFEEYPHKVVENTEKQEKNEIGCENRSEDSIQHTDTEKGGPVYMVSDLSATYFLESSPFSQQHYLAEKLRNTELWARLTQIMRRGPEIFEKEPFFGGVITCMAENVRCGLLQDTVRVVMENVDLRKINKLLDLGGGHGLYAIAFAKLNENIQASVFDLPSITEKTKNFINKYGVSNVDVIPGDFFKDGIGSGYDLIFSSFNPGGKVPSLLPKITEALNPGGIFVTRQVLDEKMKSNSFLSLDWNLWTFEDMKKGGSGYSFENSVSFTEYIEMLNEYGLEVFAALDMKDASRIVFAQKRV